MRNWFRYLTYLIVFVWVSVAHSGSYDDFFSAIQNDNVSVMRGLLAQGFDPNTLGPGGDSGLLKAIREPTFKAIDLLLEHPQTRVELRNSKDESPLMLAALKGYLIVCQKLIARDADVNKPGWSPLHYAATGGHTAVMQLLLDHYAYIDAASPNGSTPLMMAARYGSLDAVKLLLEAGADARLKNDRGLTAIDFATQVQRDDAVALIAGAIRKRNSKNGW